MSDPDSVEGWLSLAAQHEASARALADIKQTGAQAVFHAGLAVECALKAYIMRTERLNAWPSREGRPELYTMTFVICAPSRGSTWTPIHRWHPRGIYFCNGIEGKRMIQSRCREKWRALMSKVPLAQTD